MTPLYALKVSVALLLLLGTTRAFQTPVSTSSFPTTKAPSRYGTTTLPPPSQISNRGTSTITTTTTTCLQSAVAPAVVAVLDSFWKNDPYTAAAVVCGVKASAADLVAQKRDFLKRQEKLTSFTKAQVDKGGDDAITQQSTTEKQRDWKRNLAFLLYGAIYQGIAQEFIYNHLYPIWFGMAATPIVVAKKVLFDLFIQTIFVTCPIAYITKSLVFRYSPKEALRRYIHDIKYHGLLKKYFLLWGPVQCLTFSIIPEHLRVTWIAMVSFFWLIILSSISSKKKDTGKVVSSGDDNSLSIDELEAEILDCSLEDGLTCNIDG